MIKSPFLKFESSAFVQSTRDVEDTNPGVYSKALALWLAEQLRRRGLSAGEVVIEDFGWCVFPIESKPRRLHVVCTLFGDKQDSWQVFDFIEEALMNRLLHKDTGTDSLSALFTIIKQVLQSAPTVKDLREEES